MPLSADHVVSIEHFFRQRSHAAPGPIELTLGEGRLTISELDGPDLAVDWVGRSVDPDRTAVGLCLPSGERAHLGAIVDRSGRSDWFVVDDGALWFDASPSCRLIDDLCRRRLGRPTDPPTTTTDWFWIGRWLLDVNAAGRSLGSTREGAGHLLDTLTVAGRHPAVEVEELIGLDRAGITSFMVERHRDHAALADWSCVRFDALADEHHVGHRWAHVLDDGAFSRWVSGTDVALSSLAEGLVTGCSPASLELIGAVIADVVVRQSVC